MKILKKFVARRIMDETVLVPVGEAETKFDGLITLDDTALFIWEKLLSGSSRNQILHAVLEEYEVDEDAAAVDIDEFLNVLNNNGIIG
ncbi:MAG: PqqD family protein [Oscillospiraceae bacterium]|nr:PqqD family protein [Oscillospiraceae bacterium]